MQPPPAPPQTQHFLAPLLGALPAATLSKEPPSALLPLLSPILRQRVQLLSTTSSEPWLSLLCYDHSKVAKLDQAAKNESLEPHPVSGEVEVDWEYDVQIRYKRIDEETLQALVTLDSFGIDVKLIWCVNDELGGGDGWRIGEVSIPEPVPSWGEKSIAEAEEEFGNRKHSTQPNINGASGSLLTPNTDEGDDDDYWDQYDRTPSRTPAKQSPAPPTMGGKAVGDDEEYYAQYGNVQPAMDNHDPDEAHQNSDIESSLTGDATNSLHQHITPQPNLTSLPPPNETEEQILHPRPSSSTGSSGSDTVARLEREAASQIAQGGGAGETGIKQHISTSVKSLYRLARVGGIDRKEFERLVRTELECLGLMDEECGDELDHYN